MQSSKQCAKRLMRDIFDYQDAFGISEELASLPWYYDYPLTVSAAVAEWKWSNMYVYSGADVVIKVRCA